jgi:hypothetical protein
LRLQAALHGDYTLGDFEPTGVNLLAKLAGVFEEFGDFFLAGAGRKLGGGASQPLRFGLGVCDGNAKDLQQLAAANKAGLSRRTVYRRLADPDFRAQVTEVRAEMVRRAAGMVSAAGLGAAKTLTALQESATSESVRLGAARATIELGCKLRETVEWTERLAALEGRLEDLLGGPDRLEGG